MDLMVLFMVACVFALFIDDSDLAYLRWLGAIFIFIGLAIVLTLSRGCIDKIQ